MVLKAASRWECGFLRFWKPSMSMWANGKVHDPPSCETAKCQVCKTDAKERLRWRGEGPRACWLNLIAAEVSGVWLPHRLGLQVSQLPLQGLRAAPFMGWMARRPAVTWASALLPFSVPDPSSPQPCLVFLPGRLDWAAAASMCSAFVISARGGVRVRVHRYQESCGKEWSEWREEAGNRLTSAHENILMSKSSLLR